MASSGSKNRRVQPEQGLSVSRRFTKPGVDPLSQFRWERRNSKISNPDGSVVFEVADAEFPADWSQMASDIMASKYFRKAGVPQLDAHGQPLLDPQGQPVLGPERSAKQVLRRLAGTWRHWGTVEGLFASEADADSFEDELLYMLAAQMAAPNSPQFFNTGLNWAYGITGPAQGHYYVDPDTGLVEASKDAYSRPQPHACFIQSVRDDLVGEGGIMDLWMREARIFKYGSGTGTNFSCIRGDGEALSGGGTSSGLMSFLKIGDRAAGAIKSGGTTRRAAKMVIVDADHPDIEAFIDWKVNEERKVAALASQGYSADFNGDAYATVSGQNSNNSVRVSDEFMHKVLADEDWHLTWRTDHRVCKTLKARDLWRKIAEAAWNCADPGMQYDTTINDWHTSPAGGRISGSNPCSEFMFLDNSSCNLASLNLLKFYDPETGAMQLDDLAHAVRLWTMVLEISVAMAQFPSQEIARISYEYRPLGLGYANLGALLMVQGLPYDSDEARAMAGALTAVLAGEAYATSAEMASAIGPFPAYEANREAMLRVIRNHKRAAYNAAPGEYEKLSVPPQGIRPEFCTSELLAAARSAWDRALALGEQHGYRNAQGTLLAPTGTIGLLMDCATTGVEPDFALVKFKKLAGGGYFKIVNQAVPLALKNLGYPQEAVEAIIQYALGTLSLSGAPAINRRTLADKGLDPGQIETIENALPAAFDLMGAFSVAGVDLNALGFSAEEIRQANDHICGRGTVEGAPYLDARHLAVFDCANRCGTYGTRFIAPMGHVRMMAAAQPFLSGAISKTVNLPQEATVEEIEEIYMEGWRLGLKAIAIYRDGSKLSQPLSSRSGEDGPAEEQAKLLRGQRRPLPTKRRGDTYELRLAGHKIYIRTGEYEDGTLGEVFLDMHKEGASFRALLNAFAIAVSKGLQYGVPLEEMVETFVYQRFEPAGPVSGHANIKLSTSVVDLIFRTLGFEYLGRTDFVQVPPVDSEPLPQPEQVQRPKPAVSSKSQLAGLDEQLSQLMGDAPICEVCGHITVRNGSCYKCLNCGNSLGCS